MKPILLIPFLAFLGTPALQAQAPININLGEPGYYGPIVIDDSYPKPRLMFSDPRVLDEAHRTGRPLYLHIPPGHAKDWEKHCKHYDACDQPAYFVEESWYSDEYVPAYQKHRGEMGKAKGKGQGKGQGRYMDHVEDQGHDRGHDQGKGKGHEMDQDQENGKGKGQGKEKTKNKDKDKKKEKEQDRDENN